MTSIPEEVSEHVGMVLGTEDSTPLSFWVGVQPESYLQLDDAVFVDTDVPGRGKLRIAGIVQNVRAKHEGATFDTDVFLVDRGVLPVDTAVAAEVVATRFEPEIFVPPMPGLAAYLPNVGRGLFDQIEGARCSTPELRTCAVNLGWGGGSPSKASGW